MLDVPLWAWAATIAIVIALLIVDFVGHVRTPHEPTLRESAFWSAGYVAIAIVFGIIVWIIGGSDYGQEYFAGYVTEKSLSLDNLFVFVLIMASFKVPRINQQKVLLFGIIIALVLRTVFILLGAALIARFSFIFYIFGAFLLWTAYSQAKPTDEEEYKENAVLRWVSKAVPTTRDFKGDRLFHRVGGSLYITPMLIVMIAIGLADLMFAVDSIPAIFGLTDHVFLIFAANAFSLLGLRQLFFLIDGLLEKLVYLSYGLAAILGLIGVKLIIHALHTNAVPFINGGEPYTAIPEIPTTISLIAITGILTITTIASLIKTRNVKRDPQLPGPTPGRNA